MNNSTLLSFDLARSQSQVLGMPIMALCFLPQTAIKHFVTWG